MLPTIARKFAVGMVALLLIAPAFAETQTPRQALVEMFSGHGPRALERHLPKVMQEKIALMDPSVRQRFTMSPGDLPSPSMGRKGEVRWFEQGPLLMLTQDANSKLEIRVEKEELAADRDDLELSLHYTTNGQSYGDGNTTRVLLTMQQEDGIWRLSDVGFTMTVKLDGSLIENFSRQMSAMTASQTVTPATVATPEPLPVRKMAAHDLNATETAAVESVRQLLAAQAQYRAANPHAGYTCETSSLAVTDVTGYRTMVVGCKGNPVTSFKITLTPVGMGIRGQRAFCADQSGVVRFADDGHGITCLSEDNRIE